MRRMFVALLLSIVVVGTLAVSGSARQSRPDSEVLGPLLVEVRGLRAAIEQLALAGARVQLLMGRLQLQEQRITTYSRRLDELRDRRVAGEKDVQQRQQKFAELAELIRQTASPRPREVEEDLKRLKGELGEATESLVRLQNEEASLRHEISVEQGRWSDINQRLEELDRTLGRR